MRAAFAQMAWSRPEVSYERLSEAAGGLSVDPGLVYSDAIAHEMDAQTPRLGHVIDHLVRHASTASYVECESRGVDLACGVGPDLVGQAAQPPQEHDVMPWLRGRADRDGLAAGVRRVRDRGGNVIACLGRNREVAGQAVYRTTGQYDLA